MADYKLGYSGAEVNDAITQARKVEELYAAVQTHLNTHMTNQAREILLGSSGTAFKASNVEEAMAEMHMDLYGVLPEIEKAFSDYNNQIVITNAEIDTIVANALK